MVCRLCLNDSGSFLQICDSSDIQNKMFKYLQIEINDGDSFSKNICQLCFDRLVEFDIFCNEVTQNQKTFCLPCDAPNDHISAALLSKIDENIDSLQPALDDTETIDQTLNTDKFDEDELECNETGDEDGLEDPTDDQTENDNFDTNHKPDEFQDFPTELIRDSKLIVKGQQLLDLIAKFYTLKCDQCDELKPTANTFNSFDELMQHYANAHNIRGYVTCCNLKHIKLRAIALHMARHLQPDAFVCPHCSKMLTCPKILKFHIQNHLPEDERPLACSQCPRRFSYSSALVSHLILHKPESERATHDCTECDKVFVSAGRLSTHMNVAHLRQGQKYICEICSKKFACRSNLNYHMTTHQPKIRRVQCDTCGKWLKNELCLRKHMVQHSSIRYNCSICTYSALNRQCLQNHIKVQHSDEKPYKCNECDKSFKLKNTLISHMVQHTGVRKYVCQFCDRKFGSSGNYYSHRKRMHAQLLSELKLKQEQEERRLRAELKSTMYLNGKEH